MYKYPIGQFGRMKMSHMIADTHWELLEMADKIGVNRKWIQQAGNFGEHFDISIGMRVKAVAAGAIEISMKELATKTFERRHESGKVEYMRAKS
jgi:hypothetical protein